MDSESISSLRVSMGTAKILLREQGGYRMPSESNLQLYVEAAWVSSTRARYVLILMVVASVLCFAAFWNSHPRSWLNARLRLARVAAVGCPTGPIKPKTLS
jgi:hypothetical protein